MEQLINQDNDIKISINKSTVEKHLKRLKSSKATGPDNIKNCVLKNCSAELAEIISWIYQRSIDENYFPQIWKIGKIIPVPKVKNPNSLKDFRPVTITSNLAKILEKILISFLKHKLEHKLDPLQFAYREHRSTEDAVATLDHHIKSFIDTGNGNYVK